MGKRGTLVHTLPLDRYNVLCGQKRVCCFSCVLPPISLLALAFYKVVETLVPER